MDGFDVRDLHVGQVHDVDARLANYLVVAGYAVRLDADDRSPRSRTPRRERS